MRGPYLTFLLSVNFTIAIAQTPTALDILTKSIQYHDPQGKWNKNLFIFNLEETRPNGPTRYTNLEINQPEEYFYMMQKNEVDEIIRIIKKGACIHQYNGKSNISEEMVNKFRLTCDRTTFMRNYYTYLWGLPMKLKDAGTILHEEVKTKDFFGKITHQIKVTYDAAVGSDTWYFYFDTQTYALVGYRFYHDEAKNDGEYILLEEEIMVNSLRLPKIRKWYTHQEQKFLGADTLVSGQ